MPMCLLNMSDAQSGFQGLSLATTDCLCQAQPTPQPPSTSTGEPNRLTTIKANTTHESCTTSSNTQASSSSTEMVADLKEFLQPGAHHHHHLLLQGQEDRVLGRPLPDQIDPLPVRIARGVCPLHSGTLTASSMPMVTPASTHPQQALAVSGDTGRAMFGTGGVMTGTLGHCACCRFNRDSGFSDDVSCDSAFQLPSSSSIIASTSLSQQQQQRQFTGLIGGSECSTGGQCFQCYNDNIQFRGHAAVFHRPDCIQCQQWQQQQQQQQHAHQVPSHSDILRHHNLSPTCSHCASDSQTTKLNCGIYENSAFHQRHSNKSNNIPRIVCHSPATGESTLKSADSGISSPTLSDTQSLSGSAKPDLHHSKSLQEEDLTDHHKRCQLAMAGGHLSILQATTNASSSTSGSLRQHRHSTGSVLENLQNKLNSIVHTPSAEDLQAPNNKMSAMTSSGNIVDGSGWSTQPFPPTSAATSTMGDVFVAIRSATNSPVTTHNGSGSSLLQSTTRRAAAFTAGGSNSDGSSSTRTAMSGLSLGSSSAWEGSDISCDPWGADIWGGQRSSSPSGGESSGDSSGGCSGSSDVSWAMQFTGATENAQDWRTLKISTKKLSKCGFYYEHMSMEQAKLMLKPLSIGSFLLRDSSNKKYLFSLSAKTPRGVTSVRIEYRNALFMLDSDEKSQSQMPGFDCVLKLIQHYVQLSEDKRTKKCVWLESSGRKDTPVMLTRPALQGVPALTHLCRKVIHRTVPMEKLAQNLKTDFTLLQYLREYPYYV